MTFLLDPNVAYFLLVLGMVTAMLAVITPGTGYMEITALALLVAAGYSIYNLPSSPWALALLLGGMVFLFFSLRKEKPWLFLGLSLASTFAGSVFLFLTPSGQAAVNPVLALILSSVSIGFTYYVGRRTLEAITSLPAYDLKRLIGQTGDALTDIHREGTIYVSGEEWSARSDQPILAGSRVKVVAREGLVLRVEPEQK
jgi:membrane-bound serine protease (ClpP class)